MHPRQFISLLMQAVHGWIEDGASRLSASLAFYAVFSLAPLLVIVIAIAGLLFGEEAARGHIFQQVSGLAGVEAGLAVQSLVLNAASSSAGVWTTVVGLAVLLFGASTVFAELKASLNAVWGVVVKPGRTFFTLVHDRFLSFSLVLAIGFLLLVSLIISAVLAGLSHYLNQRVPLLPAVWHWVDILMSLAVISVLFALIFRTLPNVVVRWRDVWMGSGLTAFLFTLGKLGIGFYLGTSSVTSSFGAASSVIIILIWVYYSACILLFGAEFTKAYALRFGAGVVPNKRAMLLTDAMRVRLGLPATVEPPSAPDGTRQRPGLKEGW